MSAVDTVLGRLEKVKPSGRGRWRARCPACGGKNATKLSVCDADDGRVLLHCFSGCSVDAVIGAMGLQIDDLFPPRVADDERKPRVRKPWSERDAVAALGHELHVAWVLLLDVAAGRPIGKNDRARAKVCADRCAALIQEMGT